MPTRLLAVVGDPVAHSLSPAMHNAAIAALGLDATYLPLRTTHQAFPALARELLASGGALNVTAPFKDDAFALGGAHLPAAARTRAVNCVWGDPDRPSLDNTDVAGVRDAVRALLRDAAVTRVRIFGTGGAARAAACAIADGWPDATVGVVSRTKQRAEAFVRWAGASGVRAVTAAPPDRAREDLWVNATPEPSVVTDMPRGDRIPGAYLDLTYGRGAQRPVQRFAQSGARAADGRVVLVAQGAAAFEHFFGVPAPVDVMRRAVEEALGR